MSELGLASGSSCLPETPDADAGIDWTLLHQRLLPRWGLGLGWGRGSTEEQAAFDAVFAEVRKDPNLARLLLELRAVARNNAARQSRRIEYLGWAWNDYLARLGVPWYLECNVEVGPGKNRLLVQSYRVQGRATAQVGQRAYPLLVLERADRVGAHDGALGRARVHDGFGQVLVKGVREQAKLWVWPLFDRLGSHANRGDTEFARPVSAELQAALGPEHFAALSHTAPAFHALLGLRKSILERQDPGSRFRMSLPPARGYAPAFRAELERVAEAELFSPCPMLTLLEADQVDLESEALAREPELEAALVALTHTWCVAWQSTKPVTWQMKTKPNRCVAPVARASSRARRGPRCRPISRASRTRRPGSRRSTRRATSAAKPAPMRSRSGTCSASCLPGGCLPGSSVESLRPGPQTRTKAVRPLAAHRAGTRPGSADPPHDSRQHVACSLATDELHVVHPDVDLARGVRQASRAGAATYEQVGALPGHCPCRSRSTWSGC